MASGHDSVAHRGKPRLHDHMVPGSILPWAPPFGKREDSCKPPQGERLYPCAWFQVQDPSAARLDLAHVSLVSADDILRIRRVSTGTLIWRSGQVVRRRSRKPKITGSNLVCALF